MFCAKSTVKLADWKLLHIEIYGCIVNSTRTFGKTMTSTGLVESKVLSANTIEILKV